MTSSSFHTYREGPSETVIACLAAIVTLPDKTVCSPSTLVHTIGPQYRSCSPGTRTGLGYAHRSGGHSCRVKSNAALADKVRTNW